MMTNVFAPFDAPPVSLPPYKKRGRSLSDNEQKWRKAILLDDNQALQTLIDQGDVVRVTKSFNPWMLALNEGSEEIRKVLAQGQVPVGDQQLFVQKAIEEDCLISFHYLLSLIKQKPNNQLNWNSLLNYSVEKKSLSVLEEILLGDKFSSVYPARHGSVSASRFSFFTTPQANQAPVLWINSLLKCHDITSLLIKKPELLAHFFETMVKDQTPVEIKSLLQDRAFWTMEHALLFEQSLKKSQKMSHSFKEVASHTFKYLHVRAYKKFGVVVPKASLQGTTKNFLERQFISGAPLFEEYVKTVEGKKALETLVQHHSFFKEFLSRATPKTAMTVIDALDLGAWRDEHGHNPSHYMIFNNQGIQAASSIIKRYPHWLAEENNQGKASLSLLSGDVKRAAEKAVLHLAVPDKPSSFSRKM